MEKIVALDKGEAPAPSAGRADGEGSPRRHLPELVAKGGSPRTIEDMKRDIPRCLPSWMPPPREPDEEGLPRDAQEADPRAEAPNGKSMAGRSSRTGSSVASAPSGTRP